MHVCIYWPLMDVEIHLDIQEDVLADYPIRGTCLSVAQALTLAIQEITDANARQSSIQ